MSTFQERFAKAFDAERARRISAGEDQLTKTMVWKAAKASSGAFTQWYDGTTSATLDRCFLMAPILRVNPHWLFDESAPMTSGLLPSPDTQTESNKAESNQEESSSFSSEQQISTSARKIIERIVSAESSGSSSPQLLHALEALLDLALPEASHDDYAGIQPTKRR